MQIRPKWANHYIRRRHGCASCEIVQCGEPAAYTRLNQLLTVPGSESAVKRLILRATPLPPTGSSPRCTSEAMSCSSWQATIPARRCSASVSSSRCSATSTSTCGRPRHPQVTAMAYVRNRSRRHNHHGSSRWRASNSAPEREPFTEGVHRAAESSSRFRSRVRTLAHQGVPLN